MYWFFLNVSNSMIVHIQDAKSPKQELHNLQKNKMNISDYSTKVKNLAHALTFIGAPVDDEDLVVVTLNGLGKD